MQIESKGSEKLTKPLPLLLPLASLANCRTATLAEAPDGPVPATANLAICRQ